MIISVLEYPLNSNVVGGENVYVHNHSVFSLYALLLAGLQ